MNVLVMIVEFEDLSQLLWNLLSVQLMKSLVFLFRVILGVSLNLPFFFENIFLSINFNKSKK